MPFGRGEGLVHETSTDEGVVTTNDRRPGRSGAAFTHHTQTSVNISIIKHWLVGRLTLPFSTKIGYIGNKVLGGDLVLSG